MMATIVLSSYLVRHPVGGVLASNLQLIRGFTKLGHDVYLFETAGYPNSCFDPVAGVSGDDCSYGVAVVDRMLRQMGLHHRLCFVAADGIYHGLGPSQVRQVFDRCELFIDRGDHRDWKEETAAVPLRVLVDPDPGYRQIKLANALARGEPIPRYDAYYTYGHNIASGHSPVPTSGLSWRHLFHPVDTWWIQPTPPAKGPFTTVMHWTSHRPVTFGGVAYGMKDVEFEHFIDLPQRTSAGLEVAVEGKDVPLDHLRGNGWTVRPAVEVTSSLDAYLSYVRASAGEFSVVKEVYRAFDVGWFSDRSAVYLASGRPVVVQATGLQGVLPSGEGLFFVHDADDAAAALNAVRRDPVRHAKAAREIAVEYLDAGVVLNRFLDELGLSPTRKRGSP